MAPLLIPEQPVVVQLQRNRVFPTQRKPDIRSAWPFQVQLCTCSYLSWAPDFNTPFLKHHLRVTLGPRRMSCSAVTCLSPVSQPAHDTWNSEKNREEVERETFSAINAQSNVRSWPTYPLLDKSNRYTPPESYSSKRRATMSLPPRIGYERPRKRKVESKTYQKSTFGANFRFTKYSSLIAAS